MNERRNKDKYTHHTGRNNKYIVATTSGSASRRPQPNGRRDRGLDDQQEHYTVLGTMAIREDRPLRNKN